MEERFSEGGILAPIAEAKFGFEAAGFVDEQARDAVGAVSFDEEVSEGSVFAFGDAAEGIRRGGAGGGAGRLGEFEAFAEAVEEAAAGFAGEEREGRVPVGAFFGFGFSGGAVGRDIEPDMLAIGQEEFLFG